MYIVNPTEEFLNECYKCNSSTGKRLTKMGVGAIYRDNSLYYFVKTKELEKALSDLPVGLLIIDKILGMPKCF